MDGSSSFTLTARLNSFRDSRSGQAGAVPQVDTLALIDRVATITVVRTVELNYPQHLRSVDLRRLSDRLGERGLSVHGLALRYEPPEFVYGAFTNPEPKVRRRAIQTAKDAVEVCKRLGGQMVTLWLAYDGFDYPFQVDYAQVWDLALDGIAQVATHDPSVAISIEFKPSGSRSYPIFGSGALTLVAIQQLGLPNVGMTLDFCHALMAREYPAFTATLALRMGKLYGVHLNDGYGQRDDGLMVGREHLFETLELLRVLRQGDYQGVLYFDTFPEREDPVKEFEANVSMVSWLLQVSEALDGQALRSAQDRQDALASWQLLSDALRRAALECGWSSTHRGECQ